MKNTIKNILILFTIAVSLIACDKNELTVLNPAATTTVSLSVTDVVLDKVNAGVDALTVSWTDPDYGFDAGANYKIVISSGDKSATIAAGTNLAKVFETVALNKLLLGLGLKAGIPTEVSVQIQAVLSAYSSFTSNVVTFTANVYQDKLDLITNWGIVGSGYNNWGADKLDAPFYKTDNVDILVAYVTLITGEIKFRTNNAWDLNYGDDGFDGILNQNGTNIPVTAGTYKITFNTSTFAYTIEAFTWGIVGDGTPIGWPNGNPGDVGYVNDQELSYDSYSDTWKVVIALKDGAIKFRQNNSWTVNFGDTGVDGILDVGGDNIGVTAGNYIVSVNFNTGEYTLTPIPNIWAIVGDGTPIGWPNGNPGDVGYVPDQNLTIDFSADNNIWVIKGVLLNNGFIKFRADNGWTLNYGDTGLDGTLDTGGDNIPVTAGRFDITLDLNTLSYTIIPTPHT